MSWDNNIYDNPGNFGFDIVGDADYGSGYDWHMIVVWQDPKGLLYYAEDGGCSCNSPGDVFQDVEDLTPATKHEILKVLEDRIAQDREDQYGDSDSRIRESHQLIEKVAAL